MGGNDLDALMEFLVNHTAGNNQPVENKTMETDENEADKNEKLCPSPEVMETDPPVAKVPEDTTPFTDTELAKVNSFEALVLFLYKSLWIVSIRCLVAMCNGYGQVKIAQIRDVCKSMNGTLDFITFRSNKLFVIQVDCDNMFHIFQSPTSWSDLDYDEPDEEKPWILNIEDR